MPVIGFLRSTSLADATHLVDAAASPYIWRLDRLKLARMWKERPGILAWYDRVRSQPSF